MEKQRDRERPRETEKERERVRAREREREREREGEREGRRERMKYSANGLIVGHNNKKPTIIKSMEQHRINRMDKQSRFALRWFI